MFGFRSAARAEEAVASDAAERAVNRSSRVYMRGYVLDVLKSSGLCTPAVPRIVPIAWRRINIHRRPARSGGGDAHHTRIATVDRQTIWKFQLATRDNTIDIPSPVRRRMALMSVEGECSERMEPA